MITIKGPAIFLAQFIGDEAPFNTLEDICQWASDLGYKGIQLPTLDTRFIDLEQAANDKNYASQLKAKVQSYGLEITELSTHLQGQLVAVNPAFDDLFDAFAPKDLHGNPKARQQWAVQQLKYAVKASHNLGLKALATFSGALLWPFVYPWPQRPENLIETGFAELARLWLPILDEGERYDVDLCYELHPGEDLHDGVTFDMFLQKVNYHNRANILYDPSHFVLQCLDYLQFIDIYHDRIKMFHVKDAEFTPSGRQGVYGGYQNWQSRAGRFRSVGDGQVDFKAVFTKLTQYNFQGWAVLEWECAFKHPEDGAREGAVFIKDYIIRVTDKAFDNFASVDTNNDLNRKLLGL
ncbi:sugar phosphate isomerase/epimerase family protein [Sphingobacterium spiritivorum]|uniref:AP endonuclease, family 2 n=1 Tax=Sphingobacterium spiritivorum ATCC 33861 TaxID=525373 RepID=D7VQR6_SPHSI|nr:sugar phosphate isomerase/epimerase [Sphingobacterium spiritivorum]EFK56117.1 AP endonuclease, family 2 [Sphingobacterium spiritivorum ATCC 33861]QQT35765.1 sugar phosphate isomerase/epimerase [Sphingobacterium spiritivorum]WQD32486.1 sugar phosphate isomerase/epimerase [Sphingobacterium spiritivorum]SUJ10049.1 Inosose dehydratase [Sphingobacterium spiritivorum]